MTAVGVARPKAQGHAIIRTATATSVALKYAGSGPKKSQMVNAAIETATTAGTKYAATASARRWTGALDPCASSTSLTICARAESRPTFVARKENPPVVLTVAPYTASPGAFSTGTLSPVSIDSSTDEAPSMTSPSTGSLSPGLTRTTSPGTTSSTPTSNSRPSLRIRARLGCRPISARTALEALPLARISR